MRRSRLKKEDVQQNSFTGNHAFSAGLTLFIFTTCGGRISSCESESTLNNAIHSRAVAANEDVVSCKMLKEKRLHLKLPVESHYVKIFKPIAR